jgi:single-strand DNA-binding protein
MKSITIAGNCTKDAETRTTQGGQTVTAWSIAVNGFANGEKTTTFFDVQFWGKRGEAAKQFAVKGAKMAVTGDLSTREYNGKTYLQVNGADFTPMGGKQSDGGGYDAPPASGGGADIDDSEIPF